MTDLGSELNVQEDYVTADDANVAMDPGENDDDGIHDGIDDNIDDDTTVGNVDSILDSMGDSEVTDIKMDELDVNDGPKIDGPSSPGQDGATARHGSTGSHHDWVSMDIGKFGKSFYNGEVTPLTDQVKRLKLKSLTEYFTHHQYEEMIECARSTDGLINNELRCKIWPVLLKINVVNDSGDVPPQKISHISEASLILDALNLNDNPLHKDEDQVKLDINRSFTILKHIESSIYSFSSVYSPDDINFLKKNLYHLIVKFLRKYPALNYYQGFHDIASIILLITYANNKVDENLSFQLLERLAIDHLRDFMISDINLSLHHLKLIPMLLEIVDFRFFKLIKQLNNSFINSNGAFYDYSFYQGLSSILTMFSHDIDNVNQLLIIWDFILSYNSIIISIYIYVSALEFKKDEIFTMLDIAPDQEIFTNIDKDQLHNLLSSTNLFRNLSDRDVLNILNNAKFYFENYPINNLSNSTFTYDLWFKEYNKHSVLLTDSTPPFEVSKPLNIINDPNELSYVLKIQDEEIENLILYNLSIEKKIFDSQDDDLIVTTDESGSNANSLSSSISSLQSSTSTLNSKILKTSSIYFKKLLFNDGSDENKPIKRNNVFKLTTIYKISLTVGFLGILFHVFLSKHNSAIYQFTNRLINEGVYLLKNSQFVNNGFNHIGLGNIRNSIYGYIG